LKMTIRNRQAIFWALAFPLIFVVVFGVLVLDRPSTMTIVVIDNAQDNVSRELVENLKRIETFEILERQNEEQAREELLEGDIGYLLIIPGGLAGTVSQAPPAIVNLVYDETNPVSGIIINVIQRFLDQMNLDLANASTRLALSTEGTLSRDLKYIDFLLPGIAVWGVMSFSVIGLGTTLASYREKKILKRILATPLNVRTFFTAQILAYLVLALAQAAIILTTGAVLFDVSIAGNLFYIALLILIGNIVFLNMGFVVGSASKSVQAASGLGNVVVLPLLFFSGIFFPLDSMPEIIQTVVIYLPLAPIVEAVRGVTIEAKPIWDFSFELSVLAFWIAGTSLLAIKTFRFR
ncbi:MAG: ABC transporter permease, partial [Chloroflexi bacterium]|nr:ABC transporter permease [Chloroflexota bacterium]